MLNRENEEIDGMEIFKYFPENPIRRFVNKYYVLIDTIPDWQVKNVLGIANSILENNPLMDNPELKDGILKLISKCREVISKKEGA